MHIVLLTAFGVGGATVVGGLIGFLVKRIPHRFNDLMLGFAAGVMLAASVFGLIIPALEYSGKLGVLTVSVGVICGALFLTLLDRLTPHMHTLAGIDKEKHGGSKELDRVLLFVAAIAIHNLPEGLAAGVSFGTGNIADALTVAGGIALQNIPEGMVIIGLLLAVGIKKGRTLTIAMFTGLVEVAGTLIGYFAVKAAAAVLPFLLSFAGGTMLYVISDEMIPETHSHGYERGATFSLLAGFIVMLLLSELLA